ncbi:LD-carboxypeptidase [Patescibacteria group bacterium]|nr:LD-carboxypeptidase [Patescibacteria group bacterium]
MFPDKLKKGDKIMVVAPSDSLALIDEKVQNVAKSRFEQLSLELSFANNVSELNVFDSSSIESRVNDIHQAFLDSSVRGIFTAYGGYNANQLLRYLDWDLIKNNPKVFIGFSDTTVLQNAIFAKTGLVTYSGPSYARFGQELFFDYTLEYFKKCLLNSETFRIFPSELWSDDWWLQEQDQRIQTINTGWHTINVGKTTGIMLGGNLSTLNLLQGTEYFPNIAESILFLEDDSESSLAHFDRDLQSLIHLPNFDRVRGLMIGRFQKSSKVTLENLTTMIQSKKELQHIPVVANIDFGHTDPILTLPIGGEVEMTLSDRESIITVLQH